MSIPALTPAPLTAASFAPFGAVIDADSAQEKITINDGKAVRHHNIARTDTARMDTDGADKTILSIFSATAFALPHDINMMERHPLGSQAFMPLAPQHAWLVVVAEDAGGVPCNPQCFRAAGNQGVQIARNVWHHPLFILCPAQDFLVIDRDDTSGKNLQEHFFDTPIARLAL